MLTRKRFLLLFGFVALVACTTICILVFKTWPTPDLERVATPLSSASEAAPLPIFVVPQCDASNSIVAVFVHRRSKKTLSLSVVFADEDHPWPLVDQGYDVYRWSAFKRVMDVETLVYRGLRAQRAPANIDLRDVYSGEQSFEVSRPKHLDKVVAWSAFTFEGERPVIFVNTWNHMFGETTTNPGLPVTYVRDYPLYEGSRADVERFFEAVYSP